MSNFKISSYEYDESVSIISSLFQTVPFSNFESELIFNFTKQDNYSWTCTLMKAQSDVLNIIFPLTF